MERETKQSWSWKDLTRSIIWGAILIVQVLMAFLFFNSLGLIFVVYIGVACFVVFIVMGFLAGAEFRRRGGAPEGKSIIYTTKLVDTGIYSVVRHPMYTSWIFLVLALALFSQHWLSVVLGIIATVLIYLDARKEDTNLTAKFGDTYQQYMARVPRTNILLGLYRQLRRKPGNGASGGDWTHDQQLP